MLYAAGKLKNRVTFQTLDKIKDEYGDSVEGWSEFKTLWAEVFDRSGSQLITTEQIKNSVTTRFRIRYRSDLKEDMRILFRGQAYDIESILDVSGDRKFLEIVGVKGTNDG